MTVRSQSRDGTAPDRHGTQRRLVAAVPASIVALIVLVSACGNKETLSTVPGSEPSSVVESATEVGPEDPEWSADAGSEPLSVVEAAAVVEPSAPELSTAPALRWTEVSPVVRATQSADGTRWLDEPLYGITSTGDGRVVARTWHDGGEVIVTRDGTTWAEVPIPEGIEPRYVGVSGDRWLLAGTSAAEMESLARDFLPDHVVEALEEYPGALDVWLTTAGESFAQQIPPGRAFAQRVFFSDNEGTTWTELDTDLPELALPESCEYCELPYSFVVSLSSSDGRVAVVVNSVADLTLQTGMTARFFVSEGSGLELEAEWVDGWFWSAAGTHAGLVLDVGDKLLLASSDDWVGREVGDPLGSRATRSFSGSGGEGTIWAAAGASIITTRQSAGTATTSERIDDKTIERINELRQLAIDNPADRGPIAAEISALIAQTNVTQLADPVTQLADSVTQLADSVVVSLDPDAGATTTAAFRGLDLDQNLVAGPGGLAVTAEPLNLGEDGSSDTWVGWSADGADWEWQTVADAFEVLDPSAGVSFGVGGDFVLAQVDARDVVPRWFVAGIPTGQAGSRG